MSAKSFKQLSTLLQSILPEDNAESVMESWNEKKSEISKIIGNSSVAKRKKDKNAPKKCKTAYLFFCIEQRPVLKENNKKLSATEITSKLGEQWKTLSAKAKVKYEKMSQQDKVRYDEEMKSYTPPATSDEDEKPKRSKKDRTGPKRPLSAYMFFCKEQRDVIKQEHPDMNGKDVTSELGRRWKELSEEDKKPFLKKQESDKARYTSEKGGSTESAPVAPATQATPAKPAKAPAKGKKGAEQTPPSKAPPAKAPAKGKKGKVEQTPGFKKFSEEQKEALAETNPDWAVRKVNAEIVSRWNNLSDEERNEYDVAVAEDNEVEIDDE
jgi:hypothetical protein